MSNIERGLDRLDHLRTKTLHEVLALREARAEAAIEISDAGALRERLADLSEAIEAAECTLRDIDGAAGDLRRAVIFNRELEDAA